MSWPTLPQIDSNFNGADISYWLEYPRCVVLTV
jgi:hypothetical protein